MILEGNNWYSGHHLKLLLYERYCQENERINHKLKKNYLQKMYIVNIIFQNIVYKESLKVTSKKNNSNMVKDLK